MMHEWGYGFGFQLGPLAMLAVAALIVWPVWKICQKAGYPGILALLVFVPFANLIFLYWFAFADWPNLKENEA